VRLAALKSTFDAVAIALLLGVLWLLMHGYHGLSGDGQIYAFQAMARLHPHLASDLYLQNTSQDRFTLFSPAYAWCIAQLGLERAARLLTLLFTLWLLAAVWAFARAVVGNATAWAAVALLLISAGNYGGSGVFRILEPFLTARLPAQALIVTALYCQARGMTLAGVGLALVALLIHPLMALPGMLLLICLRVPPRLALIGAISGVIATLALAVAALRVPAFSAVLTLIDAPWLEVVRERSQFLFLQLWSVRDWESNAKPFLCLGFMALVLGEAPLLRLCRAAALVGAAGIAVALIGSLIGPLAILVQGQAWRWIWVADLIAVVLLPFAVVQVARDARCGWLCSMLLVLGWTLPGIGGPSCIVFASIGWLSRTKISPPIARYLQWTAVATGIAVGAWLMTKIWAVLSPSAPAIGNEPFGVGQIRQILELELPPVVLCVLIEWRVRIARTPWVPLLLCAILAGLSVLVFPEAFKQPRLLANSTDIEKFADWSKQIPPTSTVLVTPPPDVGAFVWFTLDRPNYLSLDQSAGVVFSRATALEVERRSEVLRPLMEPDWRIWTRLHSGSMGNGDKKRASHALTAEILMQVCADRSLGFVVSPEKLGLGAVPHVSAGTAKDWNLYDCSRVRSIT
jgi:hypothetical protein